MKIHNFTVCDLARQEDNGKFFLIGVYSNAIMFPRVPSQFTLTLWMLLEHESVGNTTFSLRGRMPDSGNELFDITADATVMDITNWDPFSLSVPVLIGQAGTLVLEARVNDDPWQEMRRMRIEQQAQLTSRERPR